jgi:hypothetical protein
MTDWPTCPKCHARRITRCPVCGTAGTDFPPADMDISSLLGLETPSAEDGCSCGPGGCAPAIQEIEETRPDDASASDMAAPLLMCPTCDEPFVPGHPRTCEWCGHVFDDGWDEDVRPTPVDSINARTTIVLLLVAAVLIGMAAYLAWLL